MTSIVDPVPTGFHTITPHLVVKNAAKAIEFYRKAFGADLLFCNEIEATGQVLHARLGIGDSIVMLNDEFPDQGVCGPSEKGSAVTIHLYVPDVDAVFKRAVEAGCQVTMPLADMFWGDRYGTLKDPFGHSWSVASCKEQLSEETMRERAKEAFAEGS